MHDGLRRILSENLLSTIGQKMRSNGRATYFNAPLSTPGKPDPQTGSTATSKSTPILAAFLQATRDAYQSEPGI